MHGDIVPVGEFLGDAAVARRIVLLEIVEGGVGKNDAETEGVVGAIALIDRDDGLRALLLQQDRGIQACRSTTDDRDLHERLRKGNFGDILNLKYLLTRPDWGVPAQFPWKTGL